MRDQFYPCAELAKPMLILKQEPARDKKRLRRSHAASGGTMKAKALLKRLEKGAK